METVAWVEVVDRLGSVQQRKRVDSLPVTIGRAYTNAVIIDDRFVSPEHVRLDRDPKGDLIVEDLATLNGTYQWPESRRITRLPVGRECRLRIGETLLRVRSPDIEIDPTVAYSAEFKPLGNPQRMVGVLTTSAAAYGLLSYLGSFQNLKPLPLAGLAAGTLALLLLWAGMWAFVNHITAQRFQLLAHTAAAAAIGTAYLAVGEVMSGLTFALALDRMASSMQWILVTGTLAVLLYVHSRLCAGDVSRRLFLRSTFVACGFVGLLWFQDFAADRGDHLRDYPNTLKPPAFRLAPAKPVDRFVHDAKMLQVDIDELARKARAEDPDDVLTDESAGGSSQVLVEPRS